MLPDFLLCLFQTVESCVKNCGRRFHQEVGKFRFLNEMIKVVSPKVSLLIHTNAHCMSNCFMKSTDCPVLGNGQCNCASSANYCFGVGTFYSFKVCIFL